MKGLPSGTLGSLVLQPYAEGLLLTKYTVIRRYRPNLSWTLHREFSPATLPTASLFWTGKKVSDCDHSWRVRLPGAFEERRTAE